jgi:hypothetical protein
VPLVLIGPPFFPIILFGVHHLVNQDDRHFHAHAMASDYSVAWQFLSKRTIGFSLRIKLPSWKDCLVCKQNWCSTYLWQQTRISKLHQVFVSRGGELRTAFPAGQDGTVGPVRLSSCALVTRKGAGMASTEAQDCADSMETSAMAEAVLNNGVCEFEFFYWMGPMGRAIVVMNVKAS